MDDKRVVGERNMLATLTSLHRFGWLTSLMLSELVWPGRTQAVPLARRMLAKLVGLRLALKRDLVQGGACYMLAASGARMLSEHTGKQVPRPLFLGPHNVVHRACANWYAIRRMQEGYAVWTEFEIQTGRAPVCSHRHKVPDVLVETTGGLVWVEVENAWKGKRAREDVTGFCVQNLSNLDLLRELAPGQFLCRVAIVGTNRAALLALVNDFQRDYDNRAVSEFALSNVDIVMLPLTKSLSVGCMRAFNLWYAFVEPSGRNSVDALLRA